LPLLEVTGLTKNFGGVSATSSLDLCVEPGEIHAVIGPNGAGKTTLINQLTGELHCDAGRIVFAGKDITATPVHARARLGIARSYQITQVFRELSVLQNMVIAAQARLAHSFQFWSPAVRDTRFAEPVQRALDRVGLTDRMSAPVAVLAHGELRQLELAMTLVIDPKLLLLDEPTAGMSPAETERIIRLLGSLKGQYSILLVEHDMDAVFKLADRITVLVNGRAIASGSIAGIRANPAVREAYLGEEDSED
jgi:branched-chain amino acid transport system ATP-binding protein